MACIFFLQTAMAMALTDTVHLIQDVTVTSQTTSVMVSSQTLRGAELQALSTTSIADALKYFAGVQIKDYGGLGGLKTINVRSLGAQHVGVYIDGIRLTNAQNGTVDLGKYSLSTLESISLYNANKLDICQSASEYASGATLYMRTRRPSSDSANVAVRWASFQTYMAKGNVQWNRNGWSGFADAEYLQTEGNYPFRYHSQYEDTVGRRNNSDIRYARIEGALFREGFSSHLYYYNSERGCPGGIVRRLSDKYVNVGREWDRDLFVQASYQKRINARQSLKLNGRYAYEYLRYCTNYPQNQNTARVNNHYHQNDAYASAAYAYVPWSWLTLGSSYDARISWLDCDLKHFEPVRRTDQKAVIALNTDWHGWQAALSALYQHYHDHTFTNAGAAHPLERVTPSFSLAYRVGQFTLRSWYKKIFRAPTLNDLYYTQVGNRNLKPEYTKQLDIGAEYHLFRQNATGTTFGIDVQADIYQNRIDNRIVCLPLKGTYSWSMMNYGHTFCQGLNGTAAAHLCWHKWRWDILSSITWQNDLNRTDPTEPDTYNKPICYSPKLSYGLTGICRYRDISLTLSDLHVGKRSWSYADPEDQLPAYNNLDMKLSVELQALQIWAFNPTLSIEINDLLDKQYEHLPRYPMPGRNVMITLQIGKSL